ncbi:hypothetical protein DFH06DRAFT_1137399 [Mycena polygramma]|nr:hypothetical protein DFH06DRAFT_1137399 [Mycena polygramma]
MSARTGLGELRWRRQAVSIRGEKDIRTHRNITRAEQIYTEKKGTILRDWTTTSKRTRESGPIWAFRDKTPRAVTKRIEKKNTAGAKRNSPVPSKVQSKPTQTRGGRGTARTNMSAKAQTQERLDEGFSMPALCRRGRGRCLRRGCERGGRTRLGRVGGAIAADVTLRQKAALAPQIPRTHERILGVNGGATQQEGTYSSCWEEYGERGGEGELDGEAEAETRGDGGVMPHARQMVDTEPRRDRQGGALKNHLPGPGRSESRTYEATSDEQQWQAESEPEGKEHCSRGLSLKRSAGVAPVSLVYEAVGVRTSRKTRVESKEEVSRHT